MRAARSVAFLAIVLAALPASAAAQSFEGTVSQRSVFLGPEQIATISGAPLGTRPDPALLFDLATDRLAADPAFSFETSMSFKGSKVRMALPRTSGMANEMASLMGDAYIVIDLVGSEMTTVMPSLGRGIVTDRATMTTLFAGAISDSALAAAKSATEKPVTHSLGPATINGVETMGYESAVGESVIRVWIAPGLLRVKDAMKAFTGSMMSGVDPALADRAFSQAPFDTGYALRMQMLSRVPDSQVAQMGAGWTFMWMESSVDEAPLEESLFVIPDGIAIMRMPGR
jgi:hypothetical protein